MDQVGTLGAAYVVFIFGVVLNFVLTPTAMMNAFPASIATIALNLGIDPLVLIYPFKISCDCVILPYEYVPYLIFFSFGTMTMGDFVKLAAIKVGLLSVALGVLMIPFWRLIGLA